MNINKKGFTLIELLVSFFISLLIILAITFSYRTIILGWNKTEKLYGDLQKYIYISGIIGKSLKKIKFGGRFFFKGKKNSLIYFTEDNAMHIPGITELGFFYKDNTLNVCYVIIQSYEDIVEPYVLKNTGKCFIFDNVTLKFSYGFYEDENITFKDEIFTKPVFLKIKIKSGMIDEEKIFRI